MSPIEHADTVGAAQSPLQAALNDAQTTAREQLSAAWQIQIEHIEDQLRSGWRERVGQVFEERFAELSARLAEEFERLVDARAAVAAAERARIERRKAFARLSQAVRRIGQAQTSGEWTPALLDAASEYCHRCVLFSVGLRSVIAEESRGFDEAAAAAWAGKEIELRAAPAFATAIESRDVVVAQRTAGEISPEAAALAGESDLERVHLYPVMARGRCAALLCVELAEDEAAHAALDTLVVAAGLSLGARVPGGAPTSLVSISGGGGAAEASAGWSSLSEAEQELHRRAQRFARVQVAEMRLYQASHVRLGRARQNLYEVLREPIDAARETYLRQFIRECPSMADYLHQEIVRTLANNDATLLGPAYPGPLA